MFGFLKKKLGEVISKFSEKAKEEPQDIVDAKAETTKEVPAVAAERQTAEELIQSATETIAGIAEPEPEREEVRKAEPAITAAAKAEEKAEETRAPEAAAKKPDKKGFFQRVTGAVTEAVTTTKISEEKFEQMFWNLEMTLLENNAAVEVIGKIKTDLKQVLVDKPLQRGKVEETIRKTLRGSIEGLFASGYDFNEKLKEMLPQKKPYKIMFVGINGSGKTTTIAKMAKMLQDSGMKVVIAASDTFRAAAIQQLQEHADKLGIRLVKHDYGADPAAVAFDAVKYAEAHGIDVVLIDTAGRLHSNTNLMDELKKISRVAKPDFKIFVGESIAGNDCTNQAREFNEAVGLDGIILAKADIDEKGGAAISVSYVTKKPILFLGTGQGYGDLTPFRAEAVVESLGLSG